LHKVLHIGRRGGFCGHEAFFSSGLVGDGAKSAALEEFMRTLLSFGSAKREDVSCPVILLQSARLNPTPPMRKLFGVLDQTTGCGLEVSVVRKCSHAGTLKTMIPSTRDQTQSFSV
jgi:hypothetical protein